MKKTCMILLCLFGLFAIVKADSLSSTQFEQYVQLTKKSKANPPGMTVVADKKYRIMYISMPITVAYKNVTPAVMANMKKAMLDSMKKSVADSKVIKDLKISLVYTFITTDRNLFSIPISYLDF